MANRVIQQKDLKRKRRGKHRVHGKQFINTGQGPKVGAVTELYRHKLVEDKVTQWLHTRYPGKIYSDGELLATSALRAETVTPTGELKSLSYPKKINTIPLAETKRLILRLQEKMKHTLMEMHIKVLNRSYNQIDLFFSANKTCWMFLEMKSLGAEQFVRRSITYSSQRLARQALRLQDVEWVETVPLRLPTSFP